MMGANHAITGAAAWVAITASAPAVTTGIFPQTAVGVFTGAVVCAGAALLPDADHHNGTIAHSVPGGEIVTGAISEVAGGHRQGLHSLLALVGAFVASVALGFVQIDAPFGTIVIGPAIATMALVAFASRALKLTRSEWVFPWILGALVAAGILFLAPAESAWLPVAVTVGFLVHLLGDMLTVGGVPLLWPWKPKPPLGLADVPLLREMWKPNGFFAVPILGKTGSPIEWLLGLCCTLYVLYVLVFEGFWAFGINLVTLL